MISRRILISFIPVLIILTMLSCNCEKNNNKGLIRILILSGQNNHDWSKTTPIIAGVYKNSGLFTVDITEQPDTLNFAILKNYDVVVSNWNTWPDNDKRFSDKWEADFTRFIEEGGAAVFIHAGASSFYTWDDFHRIGIGRWGKETSHNHPQIGKVTALDKENPITRGIRDFFIFDELWKQADIHPEASSIGSVSWKDSIDGKEYNEKVFFTNNTGKGRSFFTLLGHDERALLNAGLQTILIRGTIWASGHDNYPDIIPELNSVKPENEGLAWEKSDSAAGLISGEKIIWQFNFNNRYGRPYFHPIVAGDAVLTCVDPPDHPWHLGLWFCWKYINEVNYWEYLDDFKTAETGYKSEGITEIKTVNINQKSDFSADISMNISYYPVNGSPVLEEESKITVSPPLPDQSYYIDYDNIYTAVADQVILDRTPVQTEPGGRTWGGYAGLSVRFSQSLNSPFLIAANDTINYQKNDWVYMGFNTLTGNKAGVCIMQSPEYTTSNTSWYIIRTPSIPFFYYSPGVIYDGKLTLKKGDKLNLRYRTWVIAGAITEDELQSRFEEFTEND